MPFITKERREKIDSGEMSDDEWQVGDKCYYYYKKMVERWKANPRWTTAHEIFKDMKGNLIGSYKSNVPEYHRDWDVANELAWQVFFIKYVMPYEDQKEEENGTI